jgi:ABC-2 type transport system ATP-binding protein
MAAPGGAVTLSAALGHLAQAGVAVDDIGIRRPSLDEVFLALTSRRT